MISSLKLVDQFTYLGNNILSAESDANIRTNKPLLLLTGYQSYVDPNSMIKKNGISSQVWMCRYNCIDEPLDA